MKTILSFFVLLIASTAALARPQDSVSTQSVRGTIIDVSSGTPLQGATVRVLDGSELLGGAISDRRGAFTVQAIPVGRRTIAITFLGYEPYRAEDMLVTAGKEVVLNIQLTPSYTEVAAVGVEFDRILDAALTNNEYITTSGRAFNTEDTKRYAGALGDPSRMAANFAGVSGANDARNDIG